VTLTTNNYHLKVTINGRVYVVEVEDLSASPVMVKVNGQPYQVDIETTVAEIKSAVMPVSGPEKISPSPPTPRPASPATGLTVASANEVTAPMPGHIVDIAVKPGDEVRSGQELCALEAMKMRNAIRSPRDGVVARVTVSPGQAVGHGDVLVVFE